MKMRPHLKVFSALALPVLIQAQTATHTVPAAIPTVLVPFGTLPTCAQKCGPLFDAQGACAPSTISPTSDSCFCSYSSLQAFKSGTSGVCDNSGCDAADLATIQTWFKNFCASGGTATTTTAAGGSTATGTKTGTTDSSSSTPFVADKTSSTGQTWLSKHWPYVIMIVVIFVGIVVLWISACFIRRHIHKKREAAYEMRPPITSWDAGASPHPGPYGDGVVEKGSRGGPMMAAAYAPKGRSPLSKEVSVGDPMMAGVKKEKRTGKSRWMPRERT
ncbi:MAG: hypothetical protein M1818_001272 [Claussenomyces sp. TS43310]|nr:MAG: hypothetical protein M1818_001272 [Claussenomyces sp. TS43310]